VLYLRNGDLRLEKRLLNKFKDIIDFLWIAAIDIWGNFENRLPRTFDRRGWTIII
jgi:hypothetical protein